MEELEIDAVKFFLEFLSNFVTKCRYPSSRRLNKIRGTAGMLFLITKGNRDGSTSLPVGSRLALALSQIRWMVQINVKILLQGPLPLPPNVQLDKNVGLAGEPEEFQQMALKVENCVVFHV
jgi:hypothetical protein